SPRLSTPFALGKQVVDGCRAAVDPSPDRGQASTVANGQRIGPPRFWLMAVAHAKSGMTAALATLIYTPRLSDECVIELHHIRWRIVQRIHVVLNLPQMSVEKNGAVFCNRKHGNVHYIQIVQVSDKLVAVLDHLGSARIEVTTRYP